MSRKLILFFSLLTILTTIVNAAFFYSSKVRDLTLSTSQLLNVIGHQTVSEFERYVSSMDDALDSLLANALFDQGLQMLATSNTPEERASVQAYLLQAMAQEPLAASFRRIIVYTPDGFFFSSCADDSREVDDRAEKLRRTIDRDGWRSLLEASPGQRQLFEAHPDPWAVSGFIGIFSRVHPCVRDGSIFAYVQVDAPLMDIDQLFTRKDMDGLRVQINFQDGREFFGAFHGRDLFVSSRRDDTGMLYLRMADGSERLAVSIASSTLPMNIQLSQDMPFYRQQLMELLRHCMITILALLLITLFFIALFSLRVTHPVRLLTQKVGQLPADDLLAWPNDSFTTTVTHPRDQELHQLELVFNDLMEHLHASMHNEIIMREGTLQAHLNALQMQINPHFIYNTLHIISLKGMELGSQEITDLCDQFAQMLRYATDLKSKIVTLGDELQNARCYLTLLKARYEEDLEYVIDVPEAMNTLLLPKLSLQPVIENALSHGFTGRAGRREVRLTGSMHSSSMCLTIRDNGRGFDPIVLEQLQESFRQIELGALRTSAHTGEHLGLTNTYLRLFHYSGGSIRMHLYNDNGAVVVLMQARNQ